MVHAGRIPRGARAGAARAGPLAAQLAMYLGWARGGAAGAAVVGLAFVLPSFLMVLVLAAAYLRFGGLPWMQGAFYGIGAAVIAIIARSAVKLTSPHPRARRASVDPVCRGRAGDGVDGIGDPVGVPGRRVRGRHRAPVAVAARPQPHALLLVPPIFVSGLSGPAGGETLWRIGWYFAEAGAFVFGSGLAIVPFLHGGVVREFGWLTERQFLDAVAVAMITPGPVVITVGFIGYLVAGPAGAVVAALATFLPCYVFTVLPAPHFQRWSRVPAIQAFVEGVTAAATGAIAGAAFVLGRRAIVDGTTLTIAIVALAFAWRVRKLPEPVLIAAAGVAGILLRMFG